MTLNLREKPPFGKLKAIKPTKRRKAGSVVWECDCACGKKCLVSAAALVGRYIQSCGCSPNRNTSSKGGRGGEKIERNQRIMTMYDQGKDTLFIAEKMKLSRSRVFSILARCKKERARMEKQRVSGINRKIRSNGQKGQPRATSRQGG